MPWSARLSIIVGASMLLTSCILPESFAEGPLAVQVSGGDLQIAVCDDFEVVDMEGDVQTSVGGTEWETFLSISGSANLVRGTVISSTSIPEGLAGAFDDLDVESVDALFFNVAGADNSPDGVFTFSAHFEAEGSLPSTGWLRTDGRVSEEPCE